MIRVRLWGTRGSITAPGKKNWYYGGNTACVQLIAYQKKRPDTATHRNSPHLILDGGSGLTSLQIRLMKGAWGQGQGELHILLTHYHWDHIIGLPFFTPLFVKGNRIFFYGASVEDMQSSIERLFTSAYSPVEGVQNIGADLSYHPINFAGMDISGFHVQATRTNHPSKTLAFRIQYQDDVVVYAPDHEADNQTIDKTLVKFADKANLWILNAHYTQKERQRHKGWGHSSHLDAVKLALQAKVETAVLFHHNPDHDDATLDKLKQEAIAAAEGNQTQILMGRDRMVLDIGS